MPFSFYSNRAPTIRPEKTGLITMGRIIRGIPIPVEVPLAACYNIVFMRILRCMAKRKKKKRLSKANILILRFTSNLWLQFHFFLASTRLSKLYNVVSCVVQRCGGCFRFLGLTWRFARQLHPQRLVRQGLGGTLWTTLVIWGEFLPLRSVRIAPRPLLPAATSSGPASPPMAGKPGSNRSVLPTLRITTSHFTRPTQTLSGLERWAGLTRVPTAAKPGR